MARTDKIFSMLSHGRHIKQTCKRNSLSLRGHILVAGDGGFVTGVQARTWVSALTAGVAEFDAEIVFNPTGVVDDVSGRRATEQRPS